VQQGKRERLFFIRVGGSAMGPTAAALSEIGCEVWGSEEVLYEPMKSTLARSGVKVIPRFSPENLAEASPDLVVVGNAVSRGNVELEEALNRRLPLISLPQLIAERMIGANRSLAVTGTHGKTTTSAMLAHILRTAGLEPGWLIGGVPGCLPSGCSPLAPDRFQSGQGLFVVEGDEYDTAFFDKRSKFLWLRPWGVILTGIEFDHADIFEDLAQIQRSFRLLLRLIPQNGILAVRHGDAGAAPILDEARCPIVTYGIEEGDWQARNVSESPEGISFDLWAKGVLLGRVDLNASGEHNLLNWIAASIVAISQGASFSDTQSASRTFQLPKRRMETLGEWRGATVVDDFAHHPTAIKTTLRAAAAKWPGRRIWTVFEPRTNTTTRSFFQQELLESLSSSDGVFLGPLDRPWRFQPHEKLDTARLTRELSERGVAAEALTEDDGRDPHWGMKAQEWLSKHVQSGDVVLLLSNGDLGGLRGRLLAEIN
jgi:UDP-N-acetylmuramate: L-alanyl-gamma-D-glutamyl-meso-diaminopimelate ligase